MKTKKIAPSILSADFSNLERDIKMVEEAGAHLLHIDVMDGHFVPNITLGPIVVEAINEVATIPLDVHLMIDDPAYYAEAFIDAGADYLTVHAEPGKDFKDPDQLKRIETLQKAIVDSGNYDKVLSI